jgi:hypothetical protein
MVRCTGRWASRWACGIAAMGMLLGLGCASGEVDAELGLFLERGNLDYYEEVVFPTARRDAYDELFASVPLYLPLHLTYRTENVDAIITQRGDLQITTHLDAGAIYNKEMAAEDFDYLEDEQWNGESEEDRYGEDLAAELSEPDSSYRGLSEDLRLILLVNLPAPPSEDELWSSDEWDYPAELLANYQDVWIDEEDQEHDIPEDEIQLMSRMIIGGELFETLNGSRFDEQTATVLEDDSPHMVLDELVMPGVDGKFGLARGSFDLTLEADSFSASSGIATITGTFDVEVREDRWALDDLDVQEDLDDGL